jgi:hypothetical protein
VLHDDLYLRTSSPRRQFVMADATATENDQLSPVVQPRNDRDAVCGTETVIDMSVILGLEHDEFSTSRCSVCESIITRLCAGIQGHDKVKKRIKISQLNQPGSTADCRDCYLISCAMECFRDRGDVHIFPTSAITITLENFPPHGLWITMSPKELSRDPIVIFQPEGMRSKSTV